MYKPIYSSILGPSLLGTTSHREDRGSIMGDQVTQYMKPIPGPTASLAYGVVECGPDTPRTANPQFQNLQLWDYLPPLDDHV